MTDKLPQPSPGIDRWTLIRDVGLLQVKLIVDGFRDLLLVPASLIAGIISMFSPGPYERSVFYRLVCMGKQTEQWINLFSAYENAPDDVKAEYEIRSMQLDDLVGKVETFVVDEYQKGGVTKQAKEKIDKALDELQRSIKSGNDGFM